ncbi:MAG: PfkB family carbohydrate kinase, partial [Hyphomicrobiaceae bacterium]
LGLLYPTLGFEDVALDWLKRGPNMVTITDGAQRVNCYRKCGCISTLPPSVEVVDTVGAGDGFQAALLAPFSIEREPRAALTTMSNDALAKILDHAARVAAVTCGRRGADIPRV